MADRISPLAELATPGEYGAIHAEPSVRLSEDMPTALVQVVCFADTEMECRKVLKAELGLNLKHGKTVTQSKQVTALPSRPGRWLLVGDEENLEMMLRKALPANVASVTSLTHGRTQITVSGRKAAWLLATGIAIDFDLAAFPVGTVEMTHHHEIGLTIHRVAKDEFDIYLFTSFARGFWHWITKAAAEVGYRVI